MKKMFKLFLGIVAIASMTLIISCEGPAGADGLDGAAGTAGVDGADGADGTNGEDGADGADGAAGSITCLECHSETTIIEIGSEFVQSQHKLGEFVSYAGGRGSCASCHSSDGFIEFASFGFVEGSTLSSPGAWECKTCHGLHSTFEAGDYALRMTDPVTWIFDDTQTADLGGNSNLCANCHQSRRAEPNIDVPGTEFEITSSHYGPHHGAQANVVYGAGFAEIAGDAAYPTAGESSHMAASCVGCHMGEYADNEGGHTWNPSLAACVSCHATESFDYGGVQTETEELLAELRDLLVGHDVLGTDTVDEVVSYHVVVGTYPMAQAQAFFNWVGLEEDRSEGAHNPKYVKALLENSIDAIK
ncbi:MAG: hypothetical protein PF517_21310 [Salinivirgaceae bacterium]|jgi:hypothetical protein|nr:hypothetical protein [Salinivirgaceae bacterium]